MRLTITQAVGLVADVAWESRPSPRGFVPKIDPRLRAAYCPRLHSPAPSVHQPRPGRFHGHVYVPGFPAPDPGAHGLVGCAESEPRDCPPRRYGLNGLTATGRRRLTAGCCLLEEQRSLLSFWTITLPDDVMLELLQLDAWHVFQGAVRQRLTRRLSDLGEEPLVLAVAELHPQRSRDAGQALPHLHVLFRGRPHRGADWLLSPHQLDGLILSALRAAGVRRQGLPAAGNVQRIRRSVKRYLSKYVSKAPRQLVTGSDLAMLGDPRLCPRQWWFMSAPLLAMIEAATRCLPAEFLAWCCDRARAPWAGAPFVVQRVPIADPAAPSVWCITFRSPWALFSTWEAYERARILGERDPHRIRRHDRPLSGQHPEQHQQL
jgi:hypothetical protein